MGLTSNMLAGIIGGLAGGTVMQAAMMMGQRTGMIETPVPLKIERQLEERAGIDEKTTPQQEQMLAMGEHMMISAAYGAGYGALQQTLGLPALPGGAIYGLGVYALNFAGLGPALGLMPGPWREEPMTVGRRMMMHAIYGTVTALVADQMRPRVEEQLETQPIATRIMR